MLPRPSTKTGARPKKAVELSVPGWFTSTDPSRGVLVAVLIVLEPGHHRGDQPRAEIHAIEQHDINVDDEEAEEHPGRHVVPGARALRSSQQRNHPSHDVAPESMRMDFRVEGEAGSDLEGPSH